MSTGQANLPQVGAYRRSLRRHGCTFHWASRLFGRELSGDIALLYAFCRYLDDLADERTAEQARERLADVEHDIRARRSAVPVVRDFLQLAERVDISIDAVQALLSTLQSDVGPIRIDHWEQPLRYSYGVASTVGLMFCAIVGVKNHQALPHFKYSIRYAYERIPSDRFYAAARHTLKGCPNVVIETGVIAVSAHGRDHRFFVSTTEGPVEAEYVLDSRPPTLGSGPPALWQHFVGWRVQTSHDAFDPSRFMLMNFAPASDNGILFFYLLPYSEREALVEATFLTRAIFRDATHYESVLRRYLRHRLGGLDYQVTYRERGAIPMGLEAPAGGLPPAGYVPIGTRGRFVRPCTGYAFLATQLWCQSFAEDFIRSAGAATLPSAYSRWAQLLDRIFLQHLLDAPGLAPETFMRLFQRTTPEATVRFLTDQASRHDYVSVISAMPRLPFIEAAISTAAQSLTHRPPPSGWRSGRQTSTTDFGVGPLLSHAAGRKRFSRTTP